MKSIKIFDFIKYGIICIVISVIIIFFMLQIFELDISFSVTSIKNNSSFSTAIKIILNNLKNYIGYVILFPVYPIMIFMDMTITSWMISVSIANQGIAKTALLLLPHGIFEISNIIIYTYLSFINFKTMCTKNMRFTDILENFQNNMKWYIISFLLMIIAGLVEGIITPLLWNSFYIQ